MGWNAIVIDDPNKVEAAIGERYAEGALYAIAEDVPKRPPPFPGSVVLDLGASRPDETLLVWDEATRKFVPRPVQDSRDQIQKFLDDDDVKAMNLGTPDRVKLREVMARRFPDLAKKK